MDKETLETWNKVAKLYHDKFMEMDDYNPTYNYLLNLIPTKDASILEVGCGPGIITKYLLSKQPQLKIHGVDIAPNMIKIAKDVNPSATFEVMDCREIGSLSGTFDVIVSGFCLPYLSHNDARQFFVDAKNILQTKGLLYLSFVEGNPEASGYITGSTGDRTYFYYYNTGQLKNVLNEYGFEVLNEFRIDFKKADGTIDCHVAIIAGKSV